MPHASTNSMQVSAVCNRNPCGLRCAFAWTSAAMIELVDSMENCRKCDANKWWERATASVFVFLHWWHFLQAVLSPSFAMHKHRKTTINALVGCALRIAWYASFATDVIRSKFVFRFSLYATTLLLRSNHGLLFSTNDDDCISFFFDCSAFVFPSTTTSTAWTSSFHWVYDILFALKSVAANSVPIPKYFPFERVIVQSVWSIDYSKSLSFVLNSISKKTFPFISVRLYGVARIIRR